MPKGNTGAKFSLSVNRQTSIPCNLTLLPPEIHTEYTRPKERLERMAATLRHDKMYHLLNLHNMA